ncbi:hypothetical protein LJC59_08375 [Desulfovibrio sp. OttesenSCG-928-A18]|nr:hypothetical protein [Desulfovibrio sp. OttesenSCG-928-A18]
MNTQVPQSLRELAEALCPLSHSLAAGMLVRPVPARTSELPDDEDGQTDAGPDAVAGRDNGYSCAGRLCQDLDELLKECVPAMRNAMAQLESSVADELDELVDELASPALELVDMARRIWAAPLAPEAEGARALLATLAEAPVTQLLQWVLEIMHLTIDPWSLTEDPEKPELSYELRVPDTPVRDALSRWKRQHPGVLPEELLR